MTRESQAIILASISPRRRELIGSLGLAVEIVASNADEDIDPSLPAVDQVAVLARRKAEAVASAHPGSIVVGADTVVVHDGEVLNKPADAAEAERMLRRLRGVDHLVHTGLALTGPGFTATSVATSTVRMRRFTDVELAAFLATGESLDKAGGYGVQGQAGAIVESVEGCYTNVVGLPLCATARLLIGAGVAIDAQPPSCGFQSDRRCPCWPVLAGNRDDH